LDLGDTELNIKSVALGYAGVDKRFIEKAYKITSNEARYGKNYNVGQIYAEEGMGAVLPEKRNNFLIQSVVAKPADFDSVYDRGLQDYLNSGGQAIIDERRAKYEEFYE
jgi:putative aldouronate transport system substrate-binding protein